MMIGLLDNRSNIHSNLLEKNSTTILWSRVRRLVCFLNENAMSLDSDTGSAMTEYSILLAFVVVPIAAFIYKDVFDFSTNSFGSMGSLMRTFYQQLLGGLSLPVP